MLFLLGGWWLYLVFNLANKLSGLNHPSISGNLLRMVQWEGVTFFGLLFLLTILFLYIYLQDFKKTKALQAFYASLTHELKTPLASMKLQAQVLNDLILEIKDGSRDKLLKYTSRLIEDNLRLEDQLDNHLQLSRLERDAPLNLREIDLADFIRNELKRYRERIEYELTEEQPGIKIHADDFALQTILRNLIENSLTHVKKAPICAQIKLTFDSQKNPVFTYQDNGSPFRGNYESLGKLFYKYESPKGSGIGIYLMHQLAYKMQAQLKILPSPNLCFQFTFTTPRAGEQNV